MAERLRASLVGCGLGGRLSLGALMTSERYSVVAVTDLRQEVCQQLQKQYPHIRTFNDHRTMFAECPADVVCVSTYAPTHESITIDAIKANPLKGILVEKPLGDTAASGSRILQAIRDAGLPVVVPHGMLASNPALEVVAKVKQGAIGALNLVEFQVHKQDIINAGIHLLHFFVTLTKQEPVDYVLATCESSTQTYRDGMQVETTAVTYVQTKTGIRVVLNSGDDTLINRPGAGHLIRIVGSGGYIEFRKVDASYTILNAEHPTGRLITPGQLDAVGHDKYLCDLAGMIASGTADYEIPDSSLLALELVEAAYLSNRYHCKVTFPVAGFRVPEKTNWDPGIPYDGTGGGRDGKVS